MADSQHNIGDVTEFTPEAIGLPGKRTFRVIVEASHGAAVLWLEKEQLFGLAVTIQRLSTDASPQADIPLASNEEEYPQLSPDNPEVEFKIGKLAVAYQREKELYVFSVFDIEEMDDEEESPTVMFQATRDQLSSFANDSIEICQAGRPVCPLCHSAMESAGHVCSQFNGHGVHP